jgi:hypothetical protein
MQLLGGIRLAVGLARWQSRRDEAERIKIQTGSASEWVKL